MNVGHVFFKVGIDYADPYLIKEIKYRNKKIVSDPTVEKFLKAKVSFMCCSGYLSDLCLFFVNFVESENYNLLSLYSRVCSSLFKMCSKDLKCLAL